MNSKINNSEILFLYDASFSNPNGDPDEENRPRMDTETDRNLVSDLRLKRFIRDYLYTYENKDIFVRKSGDKTVSAAEREKEINEKGEKVEDKIDVKFFGAICTTEKQNKAYIGPIQFNWGYSLNKVEILDAGITSHFGSDSSKQNGAMGKDYRVKYSLIAFSGILSGNRADKIELNEEEIKLFDKSIVNAIPLQATRTKVGQYPRLYMRVEYIDSSTVIGDFRTKISITNNEGIRSINETKLDITKLVKVLTENKEKIKNITYFADKELTFKLNNEDILFENALGDLNLIKIGK